MKKIIWMLFIVWCLGGCSSSDSDGSMNDEPMGNDNQSASFNALVRTLFVDIDSVEPVEINNLELEDDQDDTFNDLF